MTLNETCSRAKHYYRWVRINAKRWPTRLGCWSRRWDWR